MSNIVKTRIQLKNDTEANWNKASGFIPLKGEVIIYSTDDTHPFSRLKVGDGVTSVKNLPFVNAEGSSRATKIYVDTYENWKKQPSLVPAQGDLMIYLDKAVVRKDDEIIQIPGLKVGDGFAYNLDLPFVGDEIFYQLIEHMQDETRHITEAERTRWNNKLNCENTVVEETLILNRS